MPTLYRLSPREAYAAYMMGSLLVDVRAYDAMEAKSLDVKRVIEIPFSELAERHTELSPNRGIILISQRGATSARAGEFLLEHGHANVSVVVGGISAWEREGLPVKQRETSEAY